MDTDAFYNKTGQYSYTKGWNMNAVAALILGAAPNIPGFFHTIEVLSEVPDFWVSLYHYAWFVGAFLAGMSYYLLMHFGIGKSYQKA